MINFIKAFSLMFLIGSGVQSGPMQFISCKPDACPKPIIIKYADGHIVCYPVTVEEWKNIGPARRSLYRQMCHQSPLTS